MKKTFLLCILIAGIFMSCSKYEEGPEFSLISKKNRISKKWQFKEVIHIESSTDISGLYESKTWEFEKSGDFQEFFGTLGSTGSWSFSGDTDLKITKNSNTNTYGILRLASDELWVEDSDNNYKLIPD